MSEYEGRKEGREGGGEAEACVAVPFVHVHAPGLISDISTSLFSTQYGAEGKEIVENKEFGGRLTRSRFARCKRRA
jgi:hypothetical protein